MPQITRHLPYYLDRLGLACYRRQLVFYCRPPAPPPAQAATPEGYEFRFMHAGDLEKAHYPGGWLNLNEAQEWLSRGDSDMLAVLHQGRICAYMWVEKQLARIDFLKLDAPLPESHIYLSKVLVTPEHRKRGLARAMYRHISCAFPHATAHSACVVENLPMHLLFTKMGWRLRMLAWLRRIGPLLWYGMEHIGVGSRRLLSNGRMARLLFLDPEGPDWSIPR